MKTIYKIFATFFCALITIQGFVLPLRAQNSQDITASVGNGIVIGQAKLFDERTLTLMLQNAEAQLARLSFIDQSKTASAIGSIQGVRRNASSLGISVTGGVSPSIKTTTNTAAGAEDGGIVTETQQGEIKPSVPPLDASVTPSFGGTLGISAQDILAEQVSLTYQVMNLRLLLERSISDRVTGNGKPRPQAVVGFQISVDPNKRYENAVAEAEITLTTKKPDSSSRVSLAALMPRDRTYNVAAVSKKSTSVGFGAVVQVINVGVSGSRSQDTLYLVKDTDTVALEKLSAFGKQPEANAVTFSWQFRPVLGRKVVEPGTRQVYAVISLPNEVSEDFISGVEIQTYWRRFNAKTGSVGEIIEKSVNAPSNYYSELKVPNFSTVEDQLRPKILNVDWDDAGGNQILVRSDGENYMPGTSIMIGDASIDGIGDSLVFQGEYRLRFLMPAQQLFLNATPRVAGRYGPPRELISAGLPDIKKLLGDKWGIKIENVFFYTDDSQYTQVDIRLKSLANKMPLVDYNYNRPIVKIGDKIFGLGDSPITISDEKTAEYGDQKKLTFMVPNAVIQSSRTLSVLLPFHGEDYRAQYILNTRQRFAATDVSVLSSDSKNTHLAVSGSYFKCEADKDKDGKEIPDTVNNTVKILINERTIKAPEFKMCTDTLLTFTVTPQEFKSLKKVVVWQKYSQPTALAMSKPPAPSPKPNIVTAPVVTEGFVKGFKFEGANFNSIDKIFFNVDQPLKFVAKETGESMTVWLTKTVTEEAGEKELSLLLKDGSVETYTITVKSKGQ